MLTACYNLKKNDSVTAIPNNNFVGEWHRTNTIKAYAGKIIIKNQTDKSFDFIFDGLFGANSGGINGTASIINTDKAVFEYTSEYNKADFAKVEFALEEDSLLVNLVDGSESALGFGHNVFIEGEYSKSEPIYKDDNTVDKTLPTDEIKEKMKTLLGESAYEQMLLVMENGIPYQDDKLTYSGFVSGAGLGVDLLIKDDKIYCLGYGLDKFGYYTLYTNDEAYKDTLPPFLHIDRPDYKLAFVYKP